MRTTNFPSLKKIAAGATLALVVVTALFLQNGESAANRFGAPRAATFQTASVGNTLPSLLGNGIAPNLW